jgi:hypothetical protein
MAPPWVWSVGLPVEEMAVSVAETTCPTMVAMAVISAETAGKPASERMEETRDWMFWTRRAVWSSR